MPAPSSLVLPRVEPGTLLRYAPAAYSDACDDPDIGIALGGGSVFWSREARVFEYSRAGYVNDYVGIGVFVVLVL